MIVLFSLFLTQAQIVIELRDVLYTANETLLCEKVIEVYNTTAPDGYCSDADNIRPSVFGGAMRVVRLQNITMSEVLVSFPTTLNTTLYEASFFPDNRGTVPLVSNLLVLYGLAVGVLVVNFVAYAGTGMWIYCNR